MNLASLLAELRRQDIRIWIDGDRLRCDAPPGVLTPELRARLSASKAELLDFLRNAEALSRQQRAIVPLQSQGRRLPLFAVGGHNGDVFCFHLLARHLDPDQPVYGLQPPGADGQGQPLERVEDIAAYFVDQILAFRPAGPYLLAGYCAGGTVAFELAQQLRRRGESVGLLALIACPHPHELRRLPRLHRYLRDLGERLGKHAPALRLPLAEQRRYLAEMLRRHRDHVSKQQERMADPVLAQRARVERATLAALARYRPAPYPGPVHLFLPDRQWSQAGGLAARWRRWAERLEEHYGPEGCTSDNILSEANSPAFARLFRRCLEEQPWSPVGEGRNAA